MRSPKVQNQSYQPPLEVGITDSDGEILLTIQETAEHLKVTTRTVYRLLSKRLLTKRWLPKSRLAFVTLSSLARYRDLSNLTIQELTLRVISLEEKVDLILRSLEGKIDVVRLDTTMEALRRNHPDLYQ